MFKKLNLGQYDVLFEKNLGGRFEPRRLFNSIV